MGLPTKETDFLADFDLHNLQAIRNKLNRNPAAYGLKPDAGESLIHWNLKHNIYHNLKFRYGDNPKFFIDTEREQKYNPFIIKLDDDSKEHYKLYRLDICVIYFDSPRHPMIMDIEIDTPHHFERKQMRKDRLRDRLLSERYDIHIERIDVDDPNPDSAIAYLHSRIG